MKTLFLILGLVLVEACFNFSDGRPSDGYNEASGEGNNREADSALLTSEQNRSRLPEVIRAALSQVQRCREKGEDHKGQLAELQIKAINVIVLVMQTQALNKDQREAAMAAVKELKKGLFTGK